ncbi:MAG: hypothetical protein IPM97_14415 [Bdellovibrionaceae bacterium]|nr:hypothetical protein [Pseudobdellovibrionaceae bacterium]
MKIANTLMTFFLVALAGEISLGASHNDFQRFRRGTYNFELETQYFKSDANYISSGDSFQRLPTGQWYELWNFLIKARYDLSKSSTWYGHLNVGLANSSGFDANRSSSSLADATFGFAYLLYDDGIDVISDFNILFPFNKISENTDAVMNSEGVIEAGGLLRVQKQFSWYVPFGYLGGIYRQDRSTLLPWGIGSEFQWKTVILGGKIFGYQTIMDDPNKDRKNLRLIVNDRVNGGSLRFYAVNPSLVDSEIYVKFKIGKALSVSVGGGTTLTGSSAAAGFHGTANVTYTWDSQPSYYLRRSNELSTDSDMDPEKRGPIFKEEVNDGVDQKIFKKR